MSTFIPLINSLNIREQTEKKEEALSFYAAKSRYSRGRMKWEEPCPVRTCFQRDRDRIIHCKAFRRLKHKTQVLIAPLGDHYVTRLTHTLEVSQIARTIARALNLNEDLTEAIALGHDLGHTPFGHIGEEVLDELCMEGFRHNEQSLRVVELLEKEGQGLNLTWEVRDGILNHSKGQVDIPEAGWGDIGTLEGQVCRIADIVAYINHDVEDAIRANIISQNDLPQLVVKTLGQIHSQRINTLVCDIISSSWSVSELEPGGTEPVITMSTEVLKAANILRQFLFERVYNRSSAKQQIDQARTVMRLLYSHFLRHENELPQEFASSGSKERKIADYIAGMTDQYALRLAKQISPYCEENPNDQNTMVLNLEI